MSLQYTLYVHVFVVMGVSDCENFSFGYRVVVTLLGCAEFIMLIWIWLSTYWVLRCPHGVHWYLQVLYLWGYFVWSCRILLQRVWVGGGTCGWVTATQLLLLGCGKFSRLFTVVLGLTLVWSVKWMVICVEMRFHLLNDYRQFSAVVWPWSLLDLAN